MASETISSTPASHVRMATRARAMPASSVGVSALRIYSLHSVSISAPPRAAGHARRGLPKQSASGTRDKRPLQDLDGQRETMRLPADRRREPLRQRPLRVLAQFVHLRDAMDTPNRTHRRAALDAVIFGTEIVEAVLRERDAWMTALLRAPMDETVFADIEVPRTGAALPVIGLALCKVLLKPVVVREVEQRLAE